MVNFSDKNIIVAGVDNVEQAGNESKPVTAPVDVVQEEISETVIVKTPNVLTKTQN